MRLDWLFAAGLMSAMPAHPAAAVTGNAVPAVWKEQHVNFSYGGRTSRYSCAGLRDKLLSMLLDLGARRDLRVLPLNCADGSVPTPSNGAGISVNIVFSTPALPDSSARPVHAGDLSAVSARFEAFTIGIDPFRNMEMSDCELVEEFARQVLPQLATRALTQDVACVANQQSAGHYWVRGEVLRALPRPTRVP